MSFLGKFTKRLLGLNHVVFCNPDFAEVETQTRWFECRKLGSTYPRGQHGSKRQDGLEHMRSFTNEKKVINSNGGPYKYGDIKKKIFNNFLWVKNA